MKIATKHYKIKYKDLNKLNRFLIDLQPFVESSQVFLAGMSEIYLTVKGKYCDSPYGSDEEDFGDVIDKYFNFCHFNLKRKPKPQHTYMGEWLSLNEMINKIKDLSPALN